jgi:ketosteroid isomerase-like protein
MSKTLPSNREVAEKFFDAYRRHRAEEMHECLDPRVKFEDLAFEDITGPEVFAMWQWFCETSDRRKEPVAVPRFAILREDGSTVLLRYGVQYTLRDGVHARPVDYDIDAELTFRDGKIVKQRDRPAISRFALATKLVGLPRCLLAITPFFWKKLREQSLARLREFQATLPKRPDGQRST